MPKIQNGGTNFVCVGDVLHVKTNCVWCNSRVFFIRKNPRRLKDKNLSNLLNKNISN